MTAEVPKYTLQQIEALELAPAADHHNLEGWVPDIASENDLRSVLEKALDYRGDVTLILKSGDRVEAFIFNLQTGTTLRDSQVHYFSPNQPAKLAVSYADISGLEFSGKDRAAGKQWEDWVRKYKERKAAGEKGIALSPEVLD